MKKCAQCGKRGFFIKLNHEGLCDNCQRMKCNEKQSGNPDLLLPTPQSIHAPKRHSFESALSSIPLTEIQLCDEKAKKFSINNMPDFSFTNITSASNAEKTGTFIAIDVETTGLNAGTDRIIEVSALKIESWEIKEALSTLINPKKSIPAAASRINHITDDMVEDAPEIYQVLQALHDFTSGYNLIGHNLYFDLKFLYKSGFDAFSEKRRYYDTLELSKKIIDQDDVSGYSLEDLCDKYKIRNDNSSHRALSDCLAVSVLFAHLFLERGNSIPSKNGKTIILIKE